MTLHLTLAIRVATLWLSALECSLPIGEVLVCLSVIISIDLLMLRQIDDLTRSLET